VRRAVRPYSRVSSQFNREELKECLRAFGIKYVFLGKELGARSEDTDCYEDGKVQYERLAQTDLFQLGLSRRAEGLKEYPALCSCVRRENSCMSIARILVARHLATRGVTIQHVHADGSLEDPR